MRFTDVVLAILAALLLGAAIDLAGGGPIIGVPAQVGAMLYVLNVLDRRRILGEYRKLQAFRDGTLWSPEQAAEFAGEVADVSFGEPRQYNELPELLDVDTMEPGD